MTEIVKITLPFERLTQDDRIVNHPDTVENSLICFFNCDTVENYDIHPIVIKSQLISDTVENF